ncbi:MAG: diguanylate cyclase [Abyssibacter sp.]|uniref:GGDEF domain-containing protein n=1 Tax=Abyssibacter sp. TaxID=2320200 RepID=UPI002EB75D3A|nr:diguanylate cyclase [Pseudomonadota bacterium]
MTTANNMARQPTSQDYRDVDPRRFVDLLSESPMAYAAMVESITGFGIYLIDARGHILTWNQGAERITGLPRARVIRQPYATLFESEGRAADLPAQILGFTKYHGHYSDEHLRRRGAQEQFRALATLDVVQDPRGQHTGFVEVIRDVTADREREAALYTQATTDVLTGLPNRAHFTQQATQEIERARRYFEPVSVAMVDVDHFKSVNDTHGHHVGDLALQHVAGILRSNARRIDILGRLGGEEFALLLPRANTQPAVELCERMRVALYQSRVETPTGPLQIAASVGVASLNRESTTLDSLLERADKALYKAKRQGRNRVEAWML